MIQAKIKQGRLTPRPQPNKPSSRSFRPSFDSVPAECEWASGPFAARDLTGLPTMALSLVFQLDRSMGLVLPKASLRRTDSENSSSRNDVSTCLDRRERMRLQWLLDGTVRTESQ